MACSQHSADDARRSGRALMAADDDEQSVAAQSAQLGALWWWKLHSDRISVHLQAAPRYHLPATPTPGTMPMAPRSNPRMVALGVGLSMVVCAVPFAFKTVRDREQAVAEMRDATYESMDAKAAARDARLAVGGRGGGQS
eukprot:jgi/Tetstr1/446795/TSEL_034276.t1